MMIRQPSSLCLNAMMHFPRCISTHPVAAATSSTATSSSSATFLARRLMCLQLNLPPCFTWCDREDELHQLVRRHVECITMHNNNNNNMLALRLFPDSSVARLSRHQHVVSSRTPPPTHCAPVDAFLHTSSPFGLGISHDAVVSSLLRVVDDVALHWMPHMSVALVLPTRMLVSQEVCHALAERLHRFRGMHLVMELPSTHFLFDAEVAAQRRDADVDGVRADVLPWCRLSTLHTRWEDLIRRDEYAALSKMRKKDLLPLHLLVPWMKMEGLLGDDGVRGMSIDTTPPTQQQQLQLLHASSSSSSLAEQMRWMMAQKQHKKEHDVVLEAFRNKATQDVLADVAYSTAEEALREARRERANHNHNTSSLDGNTLTLDIPSAKLQELVLRSLEPDDDGGVAQRHFYASVGALMRGAATDAADVEERLASAEACAAQLDARVARHDVCALHREMEEELAQIRSTAAQQAAPTSADNVDLPMVLPSSSSSSCARTVFGEGYWGSMHATINALNARFCLTFPTYHAAQVQHWRLELTQTHVPTSSIPSSSCVPLMPIALPIMSAEEMEAQRLLREGHRRKSLQQQKKHNEDDDGVDADGRDERRSTWLPEHLEDRLRASLTQLLSSKTSAHSATAEVLGAYAKVLDGGGGAEVEGLSNTPQTQPTDAAVVIRRARRRPFWLRDPQQPSSSSSSSSSSSASLADVALMEEVKEALRTIPHSGNDAAQHAGLAVGFPGTTREELQTAWSILDRAAGGGG